MLVSQFLVVLLSAAKRFDHTVLHLAHALRDRASALRNWRTGTEAEF